MSAHTQRTPTRRDNPTALAVALLVGAVLAFGFGVAHSQREDTPAHERRFENTVPAHVPIKVKLKSEKSFKDLKNRGWARELEIEVKNTGSKPIYYLYVLVVMPDVRVNGHRLTMRTAYGRRELGLPETPVEPDDQPVLSPGEALTLKFPEAKVRAYEFIRDRDGLPDPKRVEFEIQAVKFGDGTSFRGPDGKPWREATKKQSSNAPSREGDPKGRKPDRQSAKADPASLFRKASYPAPPASLLRATFFLSDEATCSSPSSPPDDCGCQNGSGCMWGGLTGLVARVTTKSRRSSLRAVAAAAAVACAT